MCMYTYMFVCVQVGESVLMNTREGEFDIGWFWWRCIKEKATYTDDKQPLEVCLQGELANKLGRSLEVED